jgi:hypothetical protein
MQKRTAEEVDSRTDPSVAKQYDNETSMAEQCADLFKLIDGQNFCMLTTSRPGHVGRCMAVAKRQNHKLLFLANAHSRKFEGASKRSSGLRKWPAVHSDNLMHFADMQRLPYGSPAARRLSPGGTVLTSPPQTQTWSTARSARSPSLKAPGRGCP